MNGPTIYRELLDAGTLDPGRKATEFLARRLGDFEHAVKKEITEHMREAYLAGVQDGFHEGLAAAAENREVPESGR